MPKKKTLPVESVDCGEACFGGMIVETVGVGGAAELRFSPRREINRSSKLSVIHPSPIIFLTREKMATLLEDVWDAEGSEVPSMAAPPPLHNEAVPSPPMISAKVADATAAAVATSDHDAQLHAALRELTEQMMELRREQSRRCGVYIVIVLLLFGALLHYIDRLQGQIRKGGV